MIIGSNDTRERSSPKLTLNAVIKKYMIGLNFSEHLALDIAQWRKKNHVANPKLIGTNAWFGQK